VCVRAAHDDAAAKPNNPRTAPRRHNLTERGAFRSHVGVSSSQPHDVFHLVGTTLEGRFWVERVVAEGGFGVVYRAQQAALERPIALKVLKTPDRFDEDAKHHFLAGFASEAKTIARIAHPNIVTVYDFGVSEMPSGGQAAWMALEWLTGVTFEDELHRRRGFGGRSPAECLTLLKPILSALAVVHAEGVAHRDIKPANMMFVPSKGGTMLKLVDFGIAKIMETDEGPGSGQTRTRSNLISFSPGYAAPEQISNGRTGPWTDVHAMGLIFSEMLTDWPSIEGEDMPLLVQQIVDRVRPTPAKRGIDAGAWEPVLCRALAVSPAERYRDAGELLRALESEVPLGLTTRASVVGDFRGASPLPVSPSASTLESMGTHMSSPAGPMNPLTTDTPTSSGPIAPQPRGPRASRYVVGSVIAVAIVAGVGWLAMARRSEALPETVAIVQTTAQTAPPASAPDPRPAQPATREPTSAPSSVPVAESPPPTVVPAPKPPSKVVPSSAAAGAPVRAPPRASTAAASKPDCVPFTLDADGNKHWHPECVKSN